MLLIFVVVLNLPTVLFTSAKTVNVRPDNFTSNHGNTTIQSTTAVKLTSSTIANNKTDDPGSHYAIGGSQTTENQVPRTTPFIVLSSSLKDDTQETNIQPPSEEDKEEEDLSTRSISGIAVGGFIAAINLVAVCRFALIWAKRRSRGMWYHQSAKRVLQFLVDSDDFDSSSILHRLHKHGDRYSEMDLNSIVELAFRKPNFDIISCLLSDESEISQDNKLRALQYLSLRLAGILPVPSVLVADERSRDPSSKYENNFNIRRTESVNTGDLAYNHEGSVSIVITFYKNSENTRETKKDCPSERRRILCEFGITLFKLRRLATCGCYVQGLLYIAMARNIQSSLTHLTSKHQRTQLWLLMWSGFSPTNMFANLLSGEANLPVELTILLPLWVKLMASVILDDFFDILRNLDLNEIQDKKELSRLLWLSLPWKYLPQGGKGDAILKRLINHHEDHLHLDSLQDLSIRTVRLHMKGDNVYTCLRKLRTIPNKVKDLIILNDIYPMFGEWREMVKVIPKAFVNSVSER